MMWIRLTYSLQSEKVLRRSRRAVANACVVVMGWSWKQITDCAVYNRCRLGFEAYRDMKVADATPIEAKQTGQKVCGESCISKAFTHAGNMLMMEL